MKKADVLLVAALLMVAALLLCVPRRPAARVAVYQGGEMVWTCPITQEGECTVSGVRVVVTAGEAYVAQSPCPDGCCMAAGRISAQGRSIVCLPMEISVVMEGAQQLDAVVY